MISQLQFKHILIVMGPIENDARTLNLAQTLVKTQEKVLIIGLGKSNRLEQKSEFLYVKSLHIPSFNRMFKLWFTFTIQVIRFLKNYEAEHYWAMDLYSLPIVLWGKEKTAKVFYDSREVYSALGTNVGHPLKQWVITEIERFVIKKADVVFTSGKMDSTYIAQFYDIDEPPVIMNLPNIQHLPKTTKLRDHFGISSSKKIMIYQGMIHPGRGLEPFLTVLPNFKDWVLCVFGSGRHWNDLAKRIDQLGISSQVYKSDPVPYQELAEWTASADAGLCFIEPLTESLRLALPNKLFEYAMAGIPVICSDLPQMAPILNEFGNGILLNSKASLQDWKNGMAHLSSVEEFEEMKKASVKLSQKFNWQEQESLIYSLINF
jgi:glycosyltransferase involved in cell wall biosynthesis